MRKTRAVSLLVLLVLVFSLVPTAMAGNGSGPSNPMSPACSLSKGGKISPKALWVYTNPYKWEYPWSGGRPHVLAVWSGMYGYGQAYTGPGGYNDTCSSSHGCIDN